MDYEKEYNHAFEIAKGYCGGATDFVRGILESMFPQLAESEDVRMRKAALEGIEYLERELGWDAIGDTDILDIKEYLKKQKEKKPSSYSNLEITNVVRKALQECEGFSNYRPDVYAARVGATVEMLLQEQKPAEWSEEDEYKVDVICRLIERATIIPRCGDDDTGIPPTRLNDKYKGELKAFVESFRVRPTKSDTWKPSEYALSLVKKVADGEMLTCMEQMAMETLCNDLQKLL